MRSERSWFNSTLFVKNLTRFWPIWGLYLVIWLLGFPINLMLDLSGNSGYYFAEQVVISCIPYVGTWMALVFSLPAAMAVWSYLYNSRSTALMHTLPIRREGLFLTNYLSGLTFLAGPTVVVFVLTALAEAASGHVDMVSLCMWLACMLLMEFFFFSFATICAMFTGHILCLPAFYAIFNGLVAGMLWLLDRVLSMFVFGYSYMGVGGMWKAAEWLTPVWKLIDSLYVNDTKDPWLVGLGYIIIYALIGILLTVLALALYRRREMERAGDVITVKWMRPVFQYGVAFCCALTFGSLLFVIFSAALPATAWTLLFFMLLCGAIGYFIARMLLEKTFRVFYAWKGCVYFLAALVVLTCVMEFDLTGYERRVPSADQVERVYIGGIDSKPYDSGEPFRWTVSDPESIEMILDLHRTIVESKREIEGYQWAWDDYDYGKSSIQMQSMNYFLVEYDLNNGKTLTRTYSAIPITEELLADPNSPAAKLEALINQPQAVQSVYGLEGLKASQIISLNLSCYSEEGIEDSYPWYPMPEECWEDVYEAVQADLAAGNLGKRYLLDSQERRENCYINDLVFSFYIETEEEGEYATRSVTISLEDSAQNTLAALKRAGIQMGVGHLMTHAQSDEWYDSADAREYDEEYDVPDFDDEYWEGSRTEMLFPY